MQAVAGKCLDNVGIGDNDMLPLVDKFSEKLQSQVSWLEDPVTVPEADHLLVQLDRVQHLHQGLLLQLHLLRRLPQVLHALKTFVIG